MRPKLKVYEVHVPVPYCEVWIIEAESVEHAKRIAYSEPSSALEDAGECEGEISSRRKFVRLRSDRSPTSSGPFE